QAGARAHLPARSRTAEARRGLARPAAHHVGTPARPARQLSHGDKGGGTGMTASLPSHLARPDPERDLVIEREIDVPVSLVWKAWTTPAHLRNWFVPRPWSVTDCEMDLRPGGI